MAVDASVEGSLELSIGTLRVRYENISMTGLLSFEVKGEREKR